MRVKFRLLSAIVGAFVVVMAVASTASASCVDPAALSKRASAGPAANLLPSLKAPQATAALANGSPTDNSASIVGLWHFTFSSEGNNVAPFFIPDGATLDDGYAQWHIDGTEIMNSLRDPATSSFCLGVWQNDGGRSYKLNHFALSWDNTHVLCTPQSGASSCFVGPTNIREQVTVDHGNTYSGNVTIDQYDTAGHLLFTLQGRISAERITAD